MTNTLTSVLAVDFAIFFISAVRACEHKDWNRFIVYATMAGINLATWIFR